jgi:hypothetical protein
MVGNDAWWGRGMLRPTSHLPFTTGLNDKWQRRSSITHPVRDSSEMVHIIESGIGKGSYADSDSLRLSYQRKASEYVLKMSSINKNRNDLNDPQESSLINPNYSNNLLFDVGQGLISRIRSKPEPKTMGLNNKIDNESNANKQIKGMRFLKTVTKSHARYFQNNNEDDSKDDISALEKSRQNIGNQIDQLMQSAMGSMDSCSLLWNTFDFSCPSCGTPFLFDQANELIASSVRVRRIGRGKCRRRRSLRYRQVQALSDQQMLKNQGGGKKFAIVRQATDLESDQKHVSHGSLIAGYLAEKQERKKQHQLLRIRDGCSSQKVVYTCGYCGWKSCYKGASAFIPKAKMLVEKKSGFERKMTIVDTVQQTSPGVKKLDERRTFPTDRIVPLMNLHTGKRKKDNRASTKGTAKKGKSSLMDFLSSLND